jgi:hypothetical protein
MKYFISIFILLTIGCSSYSISKDSFVDQINKSSEMVKTQNVASVGTNYYSNKITQIKCLDKNGREIMINPDKNTSFVFTNKQTGKSTSLYFDTVYILGIVYLV